MNIPSLLHPHPAAAAAAAASAASAAAVPQPINGHPVTATAHLAPYPQVVTAAPPPPLHHVTLAHAHNGHALNAVAAAGPHIQPVGLAHAAPVAPAVAPPPPPQPAVAAAAPVTPVAGPRKRKHDTNGVKGQDGSFEYVTSGNFAKKKIRMANGELRDYVSDAERIAKENSVVRPDGRHVCGKCGKSLASKWGLDAHISSVHGSKTFKCEYCEKSFGRRDHLVNHTQSIHTGKKDCPTCGQTCSGKEGLTRHMKEAHPVAPPEYPCSLCGKKFSSDSDKQIHYQQFHTTVSCTECGMACNGTEGLKVHCRDWHQLPGQKVAAGVPAGQPGVAAVPAPAAVAAVTASVPTSATNTPGVVYRCDYCSGTFRQRSTLQQHIETFHVELQCTFCGAAFVGQQNMLDHVKEMHNPSQVPYNDTDTCYHCEICNSRFQRKHDYDEHFIKAHVFRKATVPASAVATTTPSVPSAVTTSHNSAFSPPAPSAAKTEAEKVLLYQCPFCVNLFPSQSDLTQHITRSHAVPIF